MVTQGSSIYSGLPQDTVYGFSMYFVSFAEVLGLCMASDLGHSVSTCNSILMHLGTGVFIPQHGQRLQLCNFV